MGFLRQEYWSVLPFPSPGDLPDAGIKPMSPALASGFSAAEPPGRYEFCLEEEYCSYMCYFCILTSFKGSYI